LLSRFLDSLIGSGRDFNQDVRDTALLGSEKASLLGFKLIAQKIFFRRRAGGQK